MLDRIRTDEQATGRVYDRILPGGPGQVNSLNKPEANAAIRSLSGLIRTGRTAYFGRK